MRVRVCVCVFVCLWLLRGKKREDGRMWHRGGGGGGGGKRRGVGFIEIDADKTEGRTIPSMCKLSQLVSTWIGAAGVRYISEMEAAGLEKFSTQPCELGISGGPQCNRVRVLMETGKSNESFLFLIYFNDWHEIFGSR